MTKNSFFAICIALFFALTFVLSAEVSESKILTNAFCGGCKAKIEKAVKKIKGINEANLDLETKILHVKFDDSKTNTDKIIDKIKSIGYEATIYKEGEIQALPAHEDPKCKDKKEDKDCKDEHKTKKK